MRVPRIAAFATAALLVCQTLVPAGTSWAEQYEQQQNQNQNQQNQNQQNQNQQNQTNQNQQQETPPTAGGPGNDNGPIALPKAKPSVAPPPPPPPNIKNPPGMGNLSMRVNVPVVNVDVDVLTEKDHQFIPNLQEDNFRVYENGVPQQIIGFQQVRTPITAVLLLEFANNRYAWYLIQDMWQAAWSFAQQLQPQDYVAVETYDMHTNILTDFTQNKSVVENAIQSLQIPTWDETNVFDALYTTLDRLSRVPGRKYIILIGSGIDTFSRITLDKTLQKIKETPNVTIFTISTGGFGRALGGMGGGMPNSIEYLQADNEMQTYAKMTGGMWFEPRFQAEFPDVFQQINDSIRNQYQITYRPTDTKMDGTYRRIRVQLVNNEGQPLRMENQKHKPLKYMVVARDGYTAQLPVQ